MPIYVLAVRIFFCELHSRNFGRWYRFACIACIPELLLETRVSGKIAEMRAQLHTYRHRNQQAEWEGVDGL